LKAFARGTVAATTAFATTAVTAGLKNMDAIEVGAVAQKATKRTLENYDNLVEMSTKTRTEGFGPEVQRRILLGTYVLSAGYYDAYYLKALKVRRLIKNEFDEAFSKVDLILTPTAPNTSYKFGEKANDPLAMYLEDICTVPANLAGIPGISIPAGMSSSNLPIGMQLLGPAMGEETLLRAAFTFEQARPDCQLVAPTGEVSL